MQTTLCDSAVLDPFSFCQYRLTTTEVHIGGREVVQAFMVSLVIVMFDERLDLLFEVAG